MGRRQGASSRRIDADQRRRQVRVCLRLGAATFGLLVLVGAGWFATELLRPGRIPIHKIHLSGVDQERQEELAPLFSNYWGQNYLTLDLDGLRAQLLTNPWLHDVSIRRDWPNELRISATQRQVFGYWDEQELVDLDGQRFRPAVLPEGRNWPRLSGPAGQERVLIDAYRRAAAVVGPLHLRIESLRQNSRLEWHLRFFGGVELTLGQDDLGTGVLMRQLKRFARVYPRTLKPRFAEIELIDMRYNNGFSVRWAAAAIRAKAV